MDLPSGPFYNSVIRVDLSSDLSNQPFYFPLNIKKSPGKENVTPNAMHAWTSELPSLAST